MCTLQSRGAERALQQSRPGLKPQLCPTVTPKTQASHLTFPCRQQLPEGEEQMLTNDPFKVSSSAHDSVSLHTPESPMGWGLGPTHKHQKMQELKTLLSSSETPSPTTTTHVQGSSRNHDQDFIPVVIRSSSVYLSMPPQQC